jgi:acyl-CoA synthetase (AMP-forming)/AMP-acid ligase II
VIAVYRLKMWVCSGETLPVSVAKSFFTTFGQGQTAAEEGAPSVTLCNFYGSTEVTADVLYEVFNSEEDVDNLAVPELGLPLGRPIGDARVLLLGGDDNHVGDRLGAAGDEIGDDGDGFDEGEICVIGTCVAGGYVGHEPREDDLQGKNKFQLVGNSNGEK